jgi:hypothetical protein
MKIDIWVLSTCAENRPCFPEVFSDEAQARQRFEEALREEWQHHGPCHDDGNLLPFPDTPESANIALANNTLGEGWGEWELTKHSIELLDE